MIALLLFGLLLAAQADGITAPVKAPKPALPKIDEGACPFEGCQFGKWTAQASIPLYSTWKPGPSRKLLRTLHKGEHVTAITGIYITYKPSRIQMTQAIPEYHLKAGDIVFLYRNQGEGFATAWFNGYWFENFDASGVAATDQSKSICSKHCNAKLLEEGQDEWWVKIKTKTGQIGWVKDTNFEGMDALGMRFGPPKNISETQA